MKTNYLKKYIISSYILVWIAYYFCSRLGKPCLSCAACHHVGCPKPYRMVALTYLLLIGWRYFRPYETRTAFVKRCFSGKVKLLPLLLSFAFTFGISVLSLFLYSIMTGKPMLSYINLGTTALPLSIFLSLTSGPTGEELGWRGFMREEFHKKYWLFEILCLPGLGMVLLAYFALGGGLGVY